MKRTNPTRVQRSFAPGMYAVGATLIARVKTGWRVIMLDGDTYARSATFIGAVRKARQCNARGL